MVNNDEEFTDDEVIQLDNPDIPIVSLPNKYANNDKVKMDDLYSKIINLEQKLKQHESSAGTKPVETDNITSQLNDRIKELEKNLDDARKPSSGNLKSNILQLPNTIVQKPLTQPDSRSQSNLETFMNSSHNNLLLTQQANMLALFLMK